MNFKRFLMKNFTNIVNRLKTELSISMDKDVAEFLGMSKSAFAERKRRGVFPEEALRLADLGHPELKLDVEYILSGQRNATREFLVQNSKRIISSHLSEDDFNIEEVFITPKDAESYVLLNLEEILMLSWYRRSDSKGKSLIFDTAKMSCDLSIANMRLNEHTEKRLLSDTETKKR